MYLILQSKCDLSDLFLLPTITRVDLFFSKQILVGFKLFCRRTEFAQLYLCLNWPPKTWTVVLFELSVFFFPKKGGFIQDFAFIWCLKHGMSDCFSVLFRCAGTTTLNYVRSLRIWVTCLVFTEVTVHGFNEPAWSLQKFRRSCCHMAIPHVRNPGEHNAIMVQDIQDTDPFACPTQGDIRHRWGVLASWSFAIRLPHWLPEGVFPEPAGLRDGAEGHVRSRRCVCPFHLRAHLGLLLLLLQGADLLPPPGSRHRHDSVVNRFTGLSAVTVLIATIYVC